MLAIYSNKYYAQLARYLVLGFSNTAVCFSGLYILTEVFKINYVLSLNIATVLTWVYAFIMSKIFVFMLKSKKSVHESIRFFILQCILLGISDITAYFVVDILHFNYLTVIGVMALLSIPANFIGQKYYVFRAKTSS